MPEFFPRRRQWLAVEAAASVALDRDPTCGTYTLTEDGTLQEPTDD